MLNSEYADRATLRDRALRNQYSVSSVQRRAFTLIELMVVVGIIGLVMTIAIPAIYRTLRPDSMQKAVSDVKQACDEARANAILQGVPMELVISAQGRTISVHPVNKRSSAAIDLSSSGEPDLDAPPISAPAAAASGPMFSARLSDKIAIELMEVNFQDQMELEEARVRFKPNGTSDEFKMLLVRSDTGERRLVTLEVVTALADVESDPLKFK